MSKKTRRRCGTCMGSGKIYKSIYSDEYKICPDCSGTGWIKYIAAGVLILFTIIYLLA